MVHGRVRLFLVATVCIAVAMGADAAQAADAGRSGTLRVGFYQNPTSMDPAYSKSGLDRHVQFNVFDTLVGQDRTGKPIPALAESWTISPDSKTYTFKLRSGVKFHDGTLFDAEAAKFNLDRLLDKANASTKRVDIEVIQSVQAPNRQTLVIMLSQPLASLLAYLADFQGMMASPAAVKRAGRDFTRRPVGTGPFKLVEWVQDDHITLERNAEYWDKNRPSLDRVVFQIIPDSTVRFTGLQAASLDLALGVPPQNLVALRSPGSELRLMEQASLLAYEIRLNAQRPPFNNTTLRQALWHAIDPGVLTRNVLFGNGTVAPGPLAPTSWAFDPSFSRPGRDVALAKQKLRQGGSPDGYSFTYDVRNIPVHIQMAEALAAQAAEAGIRMKIRVMEINAVLDAVNKGNFEASDGVLVNIVDPDRMMFSYYSSKGVNNYGRYSNPTVDDLLIRARVTTDLTQRARLYHQAQRIVVEDAVRIPTVFQSDHFVMSKNVTGVTLYADGMLRLHDVRLSK